MLSDSLNFQHHIAITTTDCHQPYSHHQLYSYHCWQLRVTEEKIKILVASYHFKKKFDDYIV